MINPRFSTSFCILIFQALALTTAEQTTLNISNSLYPKISDEFRPQPSPLFEDVLRAISRRKDWNSSEDFRILELDARNAKFGISEMYDFRVRIGKTTKLDFKLRDEVLLWTKMKGENFESLVKEVSSVAVLEAFRVEGPVELLVGGDDEFSLLLPPNSSHAGLKRILVGEGITIDVRNALEVSLVQALELGLPTNKSGEINDIWFVQDSVCRPLLPLHISGSVSVTAYRTRNPDSHIETAFPLRETIELLPGKCSVRNIYKKRRCPIDSVNLRITLMEKLLTSFLGNKIDQNAGPGFLKANIKASTVFRFKIKLERDIMTNDTPQGTLADWRTRPSVERVWFEVVAIMEETRLKPLTVNEVRPFIEVDSYAWSNLMSNVSFTKFPSVLVPQEALTLDVKW